MPEITKNVKFDNIAREWRCKWATDADNAALTAVQDHLDEVLADLSSVEGVSSVQRVVCGGCHDFKVITKLPAANFKKWEESGFEPEKKFLEFLAKVKGVTAVETQTYTLEEVKMNAKAIKKAQEKKEAAPKDDTPAPVDPVKKKKAVLKGAASVAWRSKVLRIWAGSSSSAPRSMSQRVTCISSSCLSTP